MKLFLSFLLFCLTAACQANEILFLKDNLAKAHKGDYITTVQGKNYTLLHIYDITPETITIEEVTVPSIRLKSLPINWKIWLKDNAPGNTSWVMYAVNLKEGKMKAFYSLTTQSWYDLSKANPFLSTLLNLKLEKIPLNERKRIGVLSIPGAADRRPIWQPKMFFEGDEIENVTFDGWRTWWPKDGSELGGKRIDVYLPEENEKYPSYFPYWLQITGMIGSAKVRIIDSGSGMVSPAPPLKRL